jgi:ribonuclease BN (tRNA processing enzyme)
MAYVTDTTAHLDARYVEKIHGVDLLIHECNFPDGWEEHARLTGHSCATPVAQVARAAEVKELVLLHFNPLDESDDPVGVAAMREVFPNTYLGEDEMEIDF